MNLESLPNLANTAAAFGQRPKMTSIFSININWVILHLLLVLIFSTNAILCGSPVKYLPGFEGELPFKLETGYVTVGYSELFYYFFESEGNPKEDPLLLWYSGGPGCSAFNGLIYEIGPLRFNIEDYEGGLPSLQYYPYSWTKTASIIFIDAPVGSGFSYATNVHGWPTSDTLSALQTYEFLRKWLNEHPQFLNVQLFIGADSYSGITAPMVVQHVLNGNRDAVPPRMNLKGYILGCPQTDDPININSKTVAAYQMGLISDELFESAKNSCGMNFLDTDTDNTPCYEDIMAIAKLIKDINKDHTLEPKCTRASLQPITIGELDRRSLNDNSGQIPEFWCRNSYYALSYAWANNNNIQAALNVRNGTVQDWKRCNSSLSYTVDVTSVLDYHLNMSKLGLQVLVYNGDHDLVISNVGTQQWIKTLNLTLVNDWRPWLVDGEVAGYTVKYSENGYRLTYATVKGAGHTPQETKRRECFEMFHRWIHYYPL